MDLETKLIKAKAEISRNQRKLGGEVRKNETLQIELEEGRRKMEKLNKDTRSLTEERKRNEKRKSIGLGKQDDKHLFRQI